MKFQTYLQCFGVVFSYAGQLVLEQHLLPHIQSPLVGHGIAQIGEHPLRSCMKTYDNNYLFPYVTCQYILFELHECGIPYIVSAAGLSPQSS